MLYSAVTTAGLESTILYRFPFYYELKFLVLLFLLLPYFNVSCAIAIPLSPFGTAIPLASALSVTSHAYGLHNC
jgi:hypothetical protein